MDPQTVFCPNLDCPARGRVGQGNIGVHHLQERRYMCHVCQKTFSATKGTPFYRLRVAQHANDVRSQVEELHRGIKQLTGSEKCQCRKARSQRNHLACCYHAWLSFKVMATKLNKTLYEVKTDLLRDYLRAELRNPRVPAFQPA